MIEPSTDTADATEATTTDDDGKTGDRGGDRRFDRRTLLAGIGTVGTAAVAGCTADGTETAEAENTTSAGRTGDVVDPRFGYVATGPDATLPVEPDHTVELLTEAVEGRPIPEFYFQPTGMRVDVGETVQFHLGTPHHNVNAYHNALGYNQRVPKDVAPFASPILSAGDSWLYTFDVEGVYDFMCAPHETFGMVGRVVAGDATGPGASPIGEAPGTERTRVPEFGAALVLGDDALTPEQVADEGTVGWEDIAPENKRLTLAPTEAAPERDR